LSGGRTSCGKYTLTAFLQARETAVIPSGSPPPLSPVPALLILACLREGELAAGFDINTVTA
jgi:hypothetical protein